MTSAIRRQPDQNGQDGLRQTDLPEDRGFRRGERVRPKDATERTGKPEARRASAEVGGESRERNQRQ